MQISWDDVNRTEMKGFYFVARLGIDVFVTDRAIVRWKADPNGLHTVDHVSTSLRKIYGTGAFVPSDNLPIREGTGNVSGPGPSPPDPKHQSEQSHFQTDKP
jgi:hypothetical protein